MTPAIVLFGLIFVNLGPLKTLPNKYPPISVNIQVVTTKKNKYKLISFVKLYLSK